jgi:hypothetical protein
MRGNTTRNSPFASRARACAPSIAALILTGAGEASEVTLDQVKAGGAALREIGPLLFADDQQHTGLEENAHRVCGDAGKIEDDLDRLLGLENIHHRHAFAGDHMASDQARRRARSSSKRWTSLARSAGWSIEPVEYAAIQTFYGGSGT